MLDLNKIQELAVKAATLNDTKSFEFLQNSLTELKNNSNPQLRFLALRIENRLKENQNYNDYVTQQEVKKAASNADEGQREQQLRETQKQQLNATSAKLQQDKKKAEAFKNEQEELKQLKQMNDQIAYNQKINMIFEQLSVERQTLIRNLESEFNEENRQFVRNFVLDKTQTEPEASQNLHKIISHEIGEEYVRYDDRTASIDFSMQTPPKQLEETANKTQKLGDVALKEGNITAATTAYITTNNATATEAAQNAKQAEEFAKNNLQIKSYEELDRVRTQGFMEKIFEETYPKYHQQITQYNEDTTLTDEEKQEKIAKIEEKLQLDLESKAAKADIDLNNPRIKEHFASYIVTKEDVNQEQVAKLLKIDEERLKEQQEEQRKVKEAQKEFLDEIEGPNPTPTPKKEEKLEEVKTNEVQEKGKLKEEDLNDLLTAKNDFRTDPDPNSEKIANKAAEIMQATIEGRNQQMIEESQQPDNKPSYAEQVNKQLREAQKEQEQQELNQQNNNNANLASQK